MIKNGTLEVRVAKGAVTESVNRLTALATGFGGYVSETRTTANDAAGSQASATISLRVPAGAFEQLLAEASKLGEVRSASTSGQDVTAQFTDIDAQLQALNQTRDQQAERAQAVAAHERAQAEQRAEMEEARRRCRSRALMVAGATMMGSPRRSS